MCCACGGMPLDPNSPALSLPHYHCSSSNPPGGSKCGIKRLLSHEWPGGTCTDTDAGKTAWWEPATCAGRYTPDPEKCTEDMGFGTPFMEIWNNYGQNNYLYFDTPSGEGDFHALQQCCACGALIECRLGTRL